ncbi:MAG TPA: hypothetical protein VEO01_39790 [Pseudonocardiaceae bacterium]|nr:hypothetical protein [Pseudonocardiaceae bacterium]
MDGTPFSAEMWASAGRASTIAATGPGFSNIDMDNVRNLSAPQIAAAVAEVAVAAAAAADFLATQIGTPRATTLPYL